MKPIEFGRAMLSDEEIRERATHLSDVAPGIFAAALRFVNAILERDTPESRAIGAYASVLIAAHWEIVDELTEEVARLRAEAGPIDLGGA